MAIRIERHEKLSALLPKPIGVSNGFTLGKLLTNHKEETDVVQFTSARLRRYCLNWKSYN